MALTFAGPGRNNAKSPVNICDLAFFISTNIPFRDVNIRQPMNYTLYGIFLYNTIDKEPVRVYYYSMNEIAKFIKSNRKAAGLTQKEFALRSGLGLRFVRDLEQGKETVRMDKVNQALAMFGMTAVPGKITGEDNGL